MSIWHAVLVEQLLDVLEICVSSLLEMFKLNIVMEMRPVVSTPIKPSAWDNVQLISQGLPVKVGSVPWVPQ